MLQIECTCISHVLLVVSADLASSTEQIYHRSALLLEIFEVLKTDVLSGDNGHGLFAFSFLTGWL